jgi:hypothetical protein
MAGIQHQIDWARSEAVRLTECAKAPNDPNFSESDPGEAAAGLEFLRRVAGEDSEFYRAARHAQTGGVYYSVRAIWRSTAQALADWARVAEARVLERPPALSFRLDAATDLMEQVQTLLTDTGVHSAAPVMLAGAALEEALRGLVEANPSVAVAGKPGISAYANGLRSADILTASQVKDAIALADTRNEAAHGHFDLITLERAVLFVDRVNLFLQQLLAG